MSAFKPIPYDKWLLNNPEYVNKKETCQNCNGTGDCVCECCDGEHICGICNGDGNIDLGYEEYKHRVALDKAKIEKQGLKI